MKKKLNLLWNLKFNFFSVAERPLTFFAYFLNAKKVGRRRLVISPAKAGAFLFSHTRLPLSPRPLLPFGRISPAAKPRVRLPAPPFGFAAQNRARHFAARNHPVRLSASRPWLRHPAPLFCRSRHGCAAPGPQRQNPGPPRFQSGFFYAKTGGRSPPLSDGGALTKPENIILCASSCHPPRSPYPHCTLPHVRFSGIGQKKKPQRKTAAAVNTLYMSCKKTNVNPISFPIAFFLLKRFRSQMTIRLHGETNMYS